MSGKEKPFKGRRMLRGKWEGENAPKPAQYPHGEKLFWPRIERLEENLVMEMPFEARMPPFKEPYGKCRLEGIGGGSSLLLN